MITVALKKREVLDIKQKIYRFKEYEIELKKKWGDIGHG
jgi:hypothetical protein